MRTPLAGESDPNVLHCRAQIHTSCYDGQRSRGWREDGTYRASDDSIVCDACYILAGAGPNRNLDAAIREVRREQAAARRR